MTDKPDVEDLDLTDAELVEVIKNHGIDRRTVMKGIGVGAGITALGSTAATANGRGGRIDKIYGASYASKEHTVPSGLVDHEVDLHVHPGDGQHEGFPAPDGEDEDDQDDYPETFFDPVGLHALPGDIVNFGVHGFGLHTVTSFHPKFNEPPYLQFPDRVATDYGFTSPPVSDGDAWLYKFTKKGIYDIFCLPHVSLGMVMRVVVFDPDEDDISETAFKEPEPDPEAPLPPNASKVLNTKSLNPEEIVTAGEVAWHDLRLP